MKVPRAACIGLSLLACQVVYGQELGVYVDTLAGAQPYVLRSFVRPGTESFVHQQRRLIPSEYELDFRFGRLWVPGLNPADTLIAYYRTWGLSLPDQYTQPLLRQRLVEADTSAHTSASSIAKEATPSLSLSRTGSITRGILAGNNRDAIIESGLRLQVAGAVREDVHVQAVLTDESTPILPEGTTQRLSELDRVYIEIDAPVGQARLGDFAANYETSEFARLGRKVQGVGITMSSPLRQVTGTVNALGAVARGIFRRETIAVIDGVQGPYRLTGASNEPFIFIVPGSENVFVNGQRQDRGRTHDYVIDYATGEVTFTTNRILHDHHRVVVEFQYRTTEFTRTLLGAISDVTFGARPQGPPRATFGATFLREADGRTLSEAYGLTAEDEALLAAAGDSAATRSGALAVPFEAEAAYAQYVLQDTLVDGTLYEIYSAVRKQPTETVYRVQFSRVGEGEGSYVRHGHVTNGLVYAWRGPGRGNYAPVRILPKPRQHRMVDFRGSLAPVKFLQLYGEWAQSILDQNRLSSLDKRDDAGYAFTGGARLTPLSIGLGTVALHAYHRHTGAGFSTFTSNRPVEYRILWGLNKAQAAAARNNLYADRETIQEATMTWQASRASNLEVSAGRLFLGERFTSRRMFTRLAVDEARWPRLSHSQINHWITDGARGEEGTAVRASTNLSMPLFGEKVIPEVQLKVFDRSISRAGTDSLVSGSSGYTQLIPGLRWHSPIGEVGTSVDMRQNMRAEAGRLQSSHQATTWDVHFDVRPFRALTMEGRAGIRNYRTTRATVGDVWPTRQQSAVIRWSGRLRSWQRAVQLHWFYEALSERTPVMQEIYIRTGAELGEYVWVDVNENGVIELDEFLPETTQDEGNYVRTLIPSDSLQSVIGLQARASVEVDPARIWTNASEGWQRVMRNIALRTTVNVQEKSRNPATMDVYLLRLHTFRDPSHTLKGLLMVQQDLYLLKNVPHLGADFSYRHVRNLSRLAAGTESNGTDQYSGTLRAQLFDRWGLTLALSSIRRTASSESFASRNFNITSRSIIPEVTYSHSSRLQASLAATHVRKSAFPVRGSLWKVPLEVRYAIPRKLNLSARAEAASVLIRGNIRTRGLAYFELTDGRGEGVSFMWAVSAWYQLSRVLRATLTYNGRSPQDAPEVHTVRMQLSAVF